MSTPAFARDDVVRIVGQRGGRYKVVRVCPDGTAVLWGGTPMHERWRHVALARLRPAEDMPKRTVP